MNYYLYNSETCQSKGLVYIDLDEGELMHWKYIKREKLPNGKYRYYYRDTDYEDARNKFFEASKAHEEAANRSREYSRFVSYYQNQLDKANGGNKQLTDANKNLQGWKEMQKKAADESRDTYQALKTYRAQYEKAQKVYNKSAGHKVADLLNKASGAIHKAKNWLKGYGWVD